MPAALGSADPIDRSYLQYLAWRVPLTRVWFHPPQDPVRGETLGRAVSGRGDHLNGLLNNETGASSETLGSAES